MITEIKIRNFKALHGEDNDLFSLSLSPFTCLIGLNGSGKTTVLQFFDFAHALFAGSYSQWLKEREWNPSDLNYKGVVQGEANKRININLHVTLQSQFGLIAWSAIFNKNYRVCTHEIVYLDDNYIFVRAGLDYDFGDNVSIKNLQHRINFDFEGSCLGRLQDRVLQPYPALLYLKEQINNIRSLEPLSPHLLRKRSRGAPVDIGKGGENITAYLHNLPAESKEAIAKVMREFYPNFRSFRTSSKKAGWKTLSVKEQPGEQPVDIDSRHLSDGLLRLLALTAEMHNNKGLLLLDEIENGINPELAEKLVEQLTSPPEGAQILATTHSPLILNWLDDETARRSVQFVYRNRHGFTRTRPFFEIPEVAERLEVLGPGEAYLDTDLEELSHKLAAEE